MMGYGWEYSWVLMLIGAMVLIGIIASIIYALVRATHVSGRSGSTMQNESQNEGINRALTVLAERYARGEITDEEYRQGKTEITKL